MSDGSYLVMYNSLRRLLVRRWYTILFKVSHLGNNILYCLRRLIWPMIYNIVKGASFRSANNSAETRRTKFSRNDQCLKNKVTINKYYNNNASCLQSKLGATGIVCNMQCNVTYIYSVSCLVEIKLFQIVSNCFKLILLRYNYYSACTIIRY